MGCLPTHGCERFVTEPLVLRINETEGTEFVYERCLDKFSRNRRQPEILYIDSKSGQQLVIEVKNLVWPLDYAQRHQSDHMVANRIGEELRGLLVAAPYELVVPHLIKGKRSELEEFADGVAAAIQIHLPAIRAGETIGSRQPGRQWKLRRQALSEREPDESERGVSIVTVGPDQSNPALLRRALNDLGGELRRHYASCTAKFADYQDARRILVLMLSGDVYLGESDWSDLLCSAPPPQTVPEIWWADDYVTIGDRTALEFVRIYETDQ